MTFLSVFLYNLVLAADQFLNVLLLGDPDESLSGRTGRAVLSGRAKWFVFSLEKIIDSLAYILSGEIDHCINAVEPEERPLEKELWTWIKGDQK